jgi:hypothetical protein
MATRAVRTALDGKRWRVLDLIPEARAAIEEVERRIDELPTEERPEARRVLAGGKAAIDYFDRKLRGELA